jgi:hypothetical protein
MKPWRMMAKAIVAIMALAAGWGCGQAPLVAQGTVMSYDPGSKIMVIKDEAPPQVELTFSLENLGKSDIGAEPAVGDLVRVAYREQEGKLLATRLMDLTRQAELKKGGAH